jgi:serine/threonine-protein kinase HipA
MERRMVGEAVTLTVLMNGYLVGYLRQSPNGAMSFRYAPEWLSTTGRRPISLSLPLTTTNYEDQRVYNFFDNLLPDNKEIRSKIQTRFKIPTDRPFDLLRAVGSDCVGAIQLCENSSNSTVETISATPLSTPDIAKLLSGYKNTPLGMVPAVDDFRISIAGAQEKTALLWHREQWCRPQGTTPTSHIFKLPIGTIHQSNLDLKDSCENEWLCLKIAQAFGLPVANAQIQVFDGVKALIVERFDRLWSPDGSWLMRLPQEDCCQALGVSSNLKYQADGGPGIPEIMKLLLGAKDAEANREQFFRSQVLFWLLGAIDGHAKNFSVYIEAGGSYRLTPIYDVISAFPLIKTKNLPAQKIKMAMALKGSSGNNYLWSKIQPRHFIATAKAIAFSESKAVKIVQNMLEQSAQVTQQVAAELPTEFPLHVSKPVLEGIATLARKHQEF